MAKNPKWTSEEIETLKEYYPQLLVSQMLPLLPGRTARAIWVEANKLGLKKPHKNKKPQGKRWTNKEIEILQEYYPITTPKEIMQLLPKRSYFSINLKASRLSIKKLPEALSRSRGVSGDANPAKRPEVRAKISKALKGKKRSIEFRRHLSEIEKGEGNPFYGRHHTQQTREAISERRKGKRNSPATEFTSERIKKICQKPEEKKRRSIASKQLWQSKEYAEKTLRAISKALARRPNKLELKMLEILEQTFPGDWQYTGDGKVILGKLIPDFININGKKKIIEVFGQYWHTGERAKTRINLTEKGRIKEYQKLGFGCLVLWDRDIENKEKVIRLVKSFMEV